MVRELAPGQYELVMGERRWRAAQALGKESIPAIVRETRDDAMLRDALLENIHRANLNPLEEAAAYQQLLDEFGATHEELAKRIGRSRPQISNTIRLLNLPAPVQRRVAAGVLSAGHARALLGLEDSEEQETLAHRIVAEGLSVRATEELVALAVAEGGAAKKASSPQRRSKPHAPALSDLADRLSDRFDTRVKVDIGRRKGTHHHRVRHGRRPRAHRRHHRGAGQVPGAVVQVSIEGGAARVGSAAFVVHSRCPQAAFVSRETKCQTGYGPVDEGDSGGPGPVGSAGVRAAA